MKLVAKATKVITPRDESERLDKWAGTHNGTLIREIRHFPSGKIEKYYRFDTPEQRQRFLDGLGVNFNFTVKQL